VAVGDTLEEVQREIREAIEFHIESLRMHNEPVPVPSSRAAMVFVSA
jgi:predicted RNase H-like HicB family nuclease